MKIYLKSGNIIDCVTVKFERQSKINNGGWDVYYVLEDDDYGWLYIEDIIEIK